MLRLFSRPGLLTGLVVMASVGSGIVFGAVGVSVALALREVSRRMGDHRSTESRMDEQMGEGL